ncbi:O-methyltransferase [Candidatus Woesearchaeota archaeon]|nr:O-methyltransferase [Candidatus Woesearchaeota archaeon]
MNLEQLEKESVNQGIPIVGSEKGKVLEFFIEFLKPKKVLEIGTANGYSGIILGSKGAKLTTLELDDKIAKEAEQNFKNFKIDAKIIIGDALKTIKSVDVLFDLIFLDFAKKSYIKILPELLKRLKKGGIIIADNITFEGCQDYKKEVMNNLELITLIIQIKDGLSVCIKK